MAASRGAFRRIEPPDDRGGDAVDSISEPRAARAVALARTAGERWAETPLSHRLDVLDRARHRIAERALALADSVRIPGRSSADTLSAEVLPLADAVRFAVREAPRVLRTGRPSRRLRPRWLGGVDLDVLREPWGVVLIVGPANYPLFLPAVQTVQALAAGNAVVLKPAPGAGEIALAFAGLLADAGLPPHVLTVLGTEVDEARAAIGAGVDKVVLTGSHATGREVLRRLADDVVPATVELSGADAVFVLPGADLDRVARALRFGLTLNGGATCIAPRRVFVPHDVLRDVEERLVDELGGNRPVAGDAGAIGRAADRIREARMAGARIACGGTTSGAAMTPTVLAGVPHDAAILRDDLFAPVLCLVGVDDAEHALTLDRDCPYALGASIFGPEAEARRLAGRVHAGVVVVNDAIVPTADPRLPFGGRGRSGHGTTRGAQGLLEMTRPKAVAVRRGRFLPHLDPPTGAEGDLFHAWIRVAHGRTWRDRAAALPALLRALTRAARAGRSARNRSST